MNHKFLLVTGNDVYNLLKNEQNKITTAVKDAYITNGKGRAVQPESTFLRFPEMERERIISLPAYLGEPFNCAGIKWISSFPDNVNRNLEKASAVLVLNSLETGRPIALIEGSIINAKRTAAAAALSASLLINNSKFVTSVGIIGCGLINYETIHFLLMHFNKIKNVYLYDINKECAQKFSTTLHEKLPSLQINIIDSPNEFVSTCSIISIATCAVEPYIKSLDNILPSTVILHTSLRDLSPQIIFNSNNVVDDVVHACQANTSLHLASKTRDKFSLVNCTIYELISQGKEKFIRDDRPVVVSPFGMGVLDLALAHFVYNKAKKEGYGQYINDFFPQPWFMQTPK